jgi:hypothetical protein
MDITRTITYTGPAARVGGLADVLEDEGVRVEWTPPEERRGIDYSTDIQALVVAVVAMKATGAPAAIKAAVKKFRARVPWAKVEIQDESPDDGGFLD